MDKWKLFIVSRIVYNGVGETKLCGSLLLLSVNKEQIMEEIEG